MNMKKAGSRKAKVPPESEALATYKQHSNECEVLYLNTRGSGPSSEYMLGVIAHELSHVRNRDTLIATIAATIAPRSSATCTGRFACARGPAATPFPVPM